MFNMEKDISVVGVVSLVIILSLFSDGAEGCSSDPCLNGGRCLGNVTNWECYCDDTGYEGATCQKDVDECKHNSDNLCGSSFCSNTIGSYVCYCYDVETAWSFCEPADMSPGPPWTNEPSDNGGSSTSDDKTPIVDGMYPGYGPQAGGTEITLHGKNLDLVQDKGAICTIGALPGNITGFGDTNMTVIVPSSEDKGPMEIRITYDNGTSLPVDGRFTYKPNPEITNIFPLETIISGGTWLTVEGKFLNSVAEPILRIALMLMETQNSRKRRGMASVVKRSTHNDVINLDNECDKDSVTFNSMQCKVPHMGEHLTEYNYESYNLYVGVLLDGVETYKNVSQVLPEYGTVNVNVNPIFTPKQNGFLIDPEQFLTIEGESLSDGSEERDYTITIGHGKCIVEELTDKMVICLPPFNKPRQTEEDKKTFGKNKFPVKVAVGYDKVHLIGVGRYPEDTSVYYIVGWLAAVSLLVIVGSIIICCVLHYRSKRNNKYFKVRGGDTIASVNRRLAGTSRRSTAFPAARDSAIPGPSGQSAASRGQHPIVARTSTRRVQGPPRQRRRPNEDDPRAGRSRSQWHQRQVRPARRTREGYLPPV